MVELQKIATEQRNPNTTHIDTLSTLEMVRLINQEDQKVALAVAQVAPEIARAIGKPKACRAVGMANHNNPISIIVPCHRVVGADGSLTGYGGGLAAKEFLLALEQGGRPSSLI